MWHKKSKLEIPHVGWGIKLALSQHKHFHPCGDLRVTMSNRFIEILEFTHFYKHVVFIRNDENVLQKHIRDKINISVGIELVMVNI